LILPKVEGLSSCIFDVSLSHERPRRFVTNSTDRTLRQFNAPAQMGANVNDEGEILEEELEPTLRFNDPINKTAWHAVSYSPDGEWLAAGIDSMVRDGHGG
jgi:hypothetical protein